MCAYGYGVGGLCAGICSVLCRYVGVNFVWVLQGFLFNLLLVVVVCWCSKVVWVTLSALLSVW